VSRGKILDTHFINGSIAQLVRASDSYSGGRKFKSYYCHQSLPKTIDYRIGIQYKKYIKSLMAR
jgi:hypothetical protein